MSMAVGVLIGASFQGLVTSLTDNILSPVIGLFARQNFDSLEIKLLGSAIRYGAFLTALLNFIIVALVVFSVIRVMNKLFSIGEAKQEAPAPKSLCPYCIMEIHKNATRCPSCTSQLP